MEIGSVLTHTSIHHLGFLLNTDLQPLPLTQKSRVGLGPPTPGHCGQCLEQCQEMWDPRGGPHAGSQRGSGEGWTPSRGSGQSPLCNEWATQTQKSDPRVREGRHPRDQICPSGLRSPAPWKCSCLPWAHTANICVGLFQGGGNNESLTEIFLCLGGQVEAHAWETRCGGQELCSIPEVDARASAGWRILRGDHHLPSGVYACPLISEHFQISRPTYRWENGGPEQWSDLAKASLLASSTTPSISGELACTAIAYMPPFLYTKRGRFYEFFTCYGKSWT